MRMSTYPQTNADGEPTGQPQADERLAQPDVPVDVDDFEHQEVKHETFEDVSSDEEDEPQPQSPSQYPVTVSVTTSSTMSISPRDAYFGTAPQLDTFVVAAQHYDLVDYKCDPYALFPQNRRPRACTSPLPTSELTAFAMYGAKKYDAHDDWGEDGWRSGEELVRHERKQGWIGEWVVDGKNVTDIQEVIRMLRTLH
jgi:hypothetical protein